MKQQNEPYLPLSEAIRARDRESKRATGTAGQPQVQPRKGPVFDYGYTEEGMEYTHCTLETRKPGRTTEAPAGSGGITIGLMGI